ncbi:MAG: Hsp70 family protein [Candidatus Sumerlaeia bacterium]|nr:Hsp70 family protein [Candidatus Sumerlaeia bacterium]
MQIDPATVAGIGKNHNLGWVDLKMSQAEHFIGIDFGTCNSSMAWFNPKTGHAEILFNAEGEIKTPSVVYFGKEETLVGKHAEDHLDDPEGRKKVVVAAKQDLAKGRVWMLNGRAVTPVDVAAEILKKLKRDAEQTHFYAPVHRAVITYPAIFDEIEKDKLQEVARKAGFAEVELLEEPVAAAIAFTQAGIPVGDSLLVYDLGGGTFDLALVVRDKVDGSFRLAAAPRGDHVGGIDFDRAIYDYMEEEFRRKTNQPICQDGYDLQLLRHCRRYKENLSSAEQPAPLSWLRPGGVRLKLNLKRPTFESLIAHHVERSIQLTQGLQQEAAAAGWKVDAVILIGGSPRIPLIRRRLQETMQVEPRDWQHRDVAVALGAAYQAHFRWAKENSSARTSASLGAEPPHLLRRVRPNEDLSAVVASLPEGAVVELDAGTYELRQPLRIDKSLTLRGPDRDHCAIVSAAAEAVLVFEGKGHFGLEGITVRHVGTAWAHAVVVNGGTVSIRRCRFTGAVTENGDRGGSGLWLKGDTAGEVTTCESTDNQLHGIELADRARPDLFNNSSWRNHDSGIAYFGSSSGTAHKNSCNENRKHGIYVGEQARPRLYGNRCSKNLQCGIAYFGSAAGTAQDNQCDENKFRGIYVGGYARPKLTNNCCVNNSAENQ